MGAEHWIGKMFKGGSQFLESLLSIKVEAIVLFFSGIMSLIAAAICYKSSHLQYVRLVVIGQEDSDIIGISCFLLLAAGVAGILVAVGKSSGLFNFTFNLYLLAVVTTLAVNFLVVIILSDYKNQVIEHLDQGMVKQFNKSTFLRNDPLNYYDLVYAWDRVQMKLSCCGVYGYRDYMKKDSKPASMEKVLPSSCCSTKNKARLLLHDKTKQCYVDAMMEVAYSNFLNTEGCYSPLERWLVHLINKMVSLIYVAACFQAFVVLYMSFLGYRRALARKT